VLLLLQGVSSYAVANRNSIKGRIKTTGSNKWDRFFGCVEQTKNNQWTLVIHSTQTASIMCVLCNSITIIKSITIKKQKEEEKKNKNSAPKVFGNQICIASVKVVRLASILFSMISFPVVVLIDSSFNQVNGDNFNAGNHSVVVTAARLVYWVVIFIENDWQKII
jgi:hypothetical protein